MEPVGQASLENLIETGLLEVEILHPGGLALTRELAELCRIRKGTQVLDVACGTGEAVCLLKEQFEARPVGLDSSQKMIDRAEQKARARGLGIEFRRGDAHQLPFPDDSFDVVICECTLCLLDKGRALREMARVTRPGGCVGMHDLCWHAEAPAHLRQTLAEMEGERPETLEGWQHLFVRAGLKVTSAVDKSSLIPGWVKGSKEQLGRAGQLRLFWRIFSRWGVRGLWRVLKSERVFSSNQLGYCIVVGTQR